MINHFRCLLMNVDGSDPLDYPLEEITDLGYRAVTLPSAVETLRRAIFGANPDRLMLNYRCRQLLAVVHAGPLADFVTALDRRYTYHLTDDRYARPEAWGAFSSGPGLLTFGDPTAPDASGRAYHVLRVSTEAGTTTVDRLSDPPQKALFTADTDRHPLAGTGTSFRLLSPSSGQAYMVTVLARPSRSPAEIAAACENLGEPVYNAVFGLSPSEPMATFRRLWFSHPELPLRLGGLVCGLAYRTEAVRTGEG